MEFIDVIQNAVRALAGSALLCCALISSAAGYASPEKLQAELAASGEALTKLQPAATGDYLRGDADQALNRFLAASDESDWKSLFMLGNMLFTLQPEASFRWHQRAYELSRHDDLVLLELAYDYTRRDDCSKAVDAWKRVDRAGLFGSYMPMLATYCYLKLGDDAKAFAMMDRFNARYGQLEDALKDIWGEPVLRVHADMLGRFKANGSPADLDAAMENSVRFGIGSDRGRALLAMADAATRARAPLGDVAARLECLRPAIEKEASLPTNAGAASDGVENAMRDVWRERMDACGLAVDGHALPGNVALARVLVVTAIDLDIASAQELVTAHATQLGERARSKEGDIAALRLLAAMQARAGDPALQLTDDLGWSRYADSEFAASRLSGLFKPAATPTPEDLARLDAAHRQFPDEPTILRLWLRNAHPSKGDAREGWRRLALMEFRKPSLQHDDMHFQPTAYSLYEALREYRKASAPQ